MAKPLFIVVGLIACFLSGWGIYDLVNGLLHEAGRGSLLGFAAYGILVYLFVGSLAVIFIVGLIGILVGLFDN